MIFANLIALGLSIGISYTLIAGFDPALDALINTVFTDFPNLEANEPLTAATLKAFPILIFFFPMFILVRKAVKKIFKQG